MTVLAEVQSSNLYELAPEPPSRIAATVNLQPRLATRSARHPKRALLTLVFTDIVGSTDALERLGDRAWCDQLARHHRTVRRLLGAHGGREIDAAGDGFFLAFDGVSPAIRFAKAARTASRRCGLDLRIGIHTGECEILGGRVEGLAVHTAARVARAAAPGEILVTRTVRDVVAGSKLRFVERGQPALKGISEPRALFSLESDVTAP